ncbi:Glycosyltransferase, GT2 family [Acetitomaculum ruminis DSM 5522]|uniref:Glycosyltransferase, GT2 family n=1 Tax=Acetitomaculum ruminis DSM 5522 TaxID=1120918 RepID=A0A1I0YJ38_9FIRM|nr:glycosyltransferase family 2 protein [Acetitomaculum ruminis]SFB13192.1 Glycosyltransferase, GT2 family [Acetitomaculum ruminis DSM 5522]
MEFTRYLKYLSYDKIWKAMRYYRFYGTTEFVRMFRDKFENSIPLDYEKWYKKNRKKREKIEVSESIAFNILIKNDYKYKEELLDTTVSSILRQRYKNFDILYADDDDLKKKIKGQYCLIVETGDILGKDFLMEVADFLQKNPIKAVYTDNDHYKIKDNKMHHLNPYFKIAYSPDLLNCTNYIQNSIVLRTDLLMEIIDDCGHIPESYELNLRIFEKEGMKEVGHLPNMIYHSYIRYIDEKAEIKALEEHFKRIGKNVNVKPSDYKGFYNIKYEIEGNPLVSIIIPNKDHPDMLEKCLSSIRKSTYENIEIIIVENNSEKKQTFDYYKRIKDREKIRLIRWKKAFNYSAINNYAVRKSRGEYLIFLNNDVELITKDWIERLLGHAQKEKSGAVGARLYYPDNTIQHDGVIMTKAGVAGHAFQGYEKDEATYLNKAIFTSNVSAVTAACLMVSRKKFNEVKGFEEKLAVAFNDVDFCLKLVKAGYFNICEPSVEGFHYESKTRGLDISFKDRNRFLHETIFMEDRWMDYIKDGDPYYNKNLSLKNWDHRLGGYV